MQITTYGLDLAKKVMQLHWVDMETGEIHRKQLKRRALLEFFANRQPGLIAMEACGTSHYWARELRKLGHEVRLIAAQFVRPFVKTKWQMLPEYGRLTHRVSLHFRGKTNPIKGILPNQQR